MTEKCFLYSSCIPQGKPQNTRVGSLSLLHHIFLTQGLNWGLLHCRRILYQRTHKGNPWKVIHPHSLQKRILLTPSRFTSSERLPTYLTLLFPSCPSFLPSLTPYFNVFFLLSFSFISSSLPSFLSFYSSFLPF